MVKSGYLPIKHLAHALWFKHDENDSTLMTILSAFYDASASHIDDRGIITVAGFVSTAPKWIRFEREWNKVLERFDVPYLHMKEFVHSTGAFSGWKHKEDKRREFIIALLKVAKKGVHKGFGHSIFVNDFEEVNKDFLLKETWGNPYALAGMASVTRTSEWKKKHFPHKSIGYFFESGDHGSHHLGKCLSSHGLFHAFAPKKWINNGRFEYNVGFQLSDFAAWENRAAILRMTDDPLRSLRQSFEALYKQIPAYFGVLPKEKIEKMCRAKNLHRR